MYQNSTFTHGDKLTTGVLLINLGTPDAPTKSALYHYLKEFLSDNRVVEPQNKWAWKAILHGIILRTRPAKSAKAYKTVWGKMGEGSPLLDIAVAQRNLLQARLDSDFADEVHVALGMRYGNPSIKRALQALKAKQVRRLIVLPLYPQYAAATTASSLDVVFDELKTWRVIPEMRIINHYHRHGDYIAALAQSVQSHWSEHGKPDKLICSYHGIPLRFWQGGDPYPCECFATTRLLKEKLGLDDNIIQSTFQSRFGKEPWVEPYTDETLKRLGAEGAEHVQVICPGFSADCLETIEEIDEENREYFIKAGGKTFSYIPALNASELHIKALTSLVLQHAPDWAAHIDLQADRNKHVHTMEG